MAEPSAVAPERKAILDILNERSEAANRRKEQQGLILGEMQKKTPEEAAGIIETMKGGGVMESFKGPGGPIERQEQRSLLSQEKQRFLEGELVEQGVDIEAGGPMGVRAEMSLTPPERQDIVLDNAFGDDGWRNTDLGVVATIDTEDGPQEFLLDESGLGMGDFADLMGSAPEIAASLVAAGGVAAVAPELATGGVISLLGYATFVAVAGQVAGGATDLMYSLKNGGFDYSKEEDRDLLMNIAKRRGANAAIDTVLDFATAGGARMLSPKGRMMRSSPQREIQAASERRGVPLSIGEKTGSPLIMRAEALTEKVPGAVGPAIKLQRTTTEKMRGAIDEAVGEPQGAEAVGRAFSEELTSQHGKAIGEVERLRGEADVLVDRRIARLEKKMATRGLTPSEAGEWTRHRISRERRVFKLKQGKIEDHAQALIDELPEAEQAFIPSSGLAETVEKLRGQQVLDKSGKPIKEFLPKELTNLFKGIDQLPEFMTVAQIRCLRNTIANAIDDDAAMPGVAQGVLKQLEAATTKALKGGIDKAPTEDIAYFLNTALDHYRVGSAKFREASIAKIFRSSERAGYVENEDVINGLINKGKVEDVKRVYDVIGYNSAVARSSRRATFEEMMDRSGTSILKGSTTDVKKLDAAFHKMSPKMRDLVFGSDSVEIDQIIRLMAAKGGDIDLSSIKDAPGTSHILVRLRAAAAKELTVRQDFDNKIIKPILKGELGISSLAPEDFVKHTMKTGSLDDARKLLELTPPELKDAYQKQAIVQILQMAEVSGKDAGEKILMFQRGVSDPGDKLLDVMREKFGPDAETSVEKIKLLLGDDGFSLMEDMGILAAARKRKADAAKAVGGLVGGSILSSLLTFELRAAVSMVKYRFVSTMIRLPMVRKWLTNDLVFKGKSAGQSFALVLPQLTRAVTEEFGEDSEKAQAINDYLTDPHGFRTLVEKTLGEEMEHAAPAVFKSAKDITNIMESVLGIKPDEENE